MSTPSHEQLAARLATWLEATDIGRLELRGPGLHVCLQRQGGRVIAVPPGSPGATAMTGAAAVAGAASSIEAGYETAVPVKAGSVGIFESTHPLHEAPLAAAGQWVEAGQVIGLLRIGTLLLPVRAPHDGIVVAWHVSTGAVVDFGSTLAELAPLASE